MPKKRKRMAQRNTTKGTEKTVSTSAVVPPRTNTRRGGTSRMDAAQVVFMPVFVALGCWGLAISFLFFFPDPNHVLYAGMAAAMGLIWSIITGLRIRRVLQMSREGRIYR